MIYVKDIIRECNATLIQGDLSLPCLNFSKDTRTINEGDIYIAIKGNTFDGNKFYENAFDKGASACIVDDIDINNINKKYSSKTIIKVNNTITCLGQLAKYKRKLTNIPVVAVTGSVGKTSTKDMIASVLSTKYKVLKTEGNNNNHIGLPLTILKHQDEEIMVLEMGMNNLGEISYLTNIASPTIAVITNIGTAHIGNLGSRENILKAKLEITEGLNGPLIINNDNDIIHDHMSEIASSNEVITFGINNSSDYQAQNISSDYKDFTIENQEINCPINSEVFIYNSLVSYVIGKLCNIDYQNIKIGIASFKPTGGRLEYKKMKNGATLIDDTYNASLDSIKSSLQILKNSEGKRKIAVIGDILELGSYSKELHREVGKALLSNNIDIIVTIGEETKYTDEYLMEQNFINYFHFPNEKESHDFLNTLIQSDDVVLFKGSHGMQLGNIVTALLSR